MENLDLILDIVYGYIKFQGIIWIGAIIIFIASLIFNFINYLIDERRKHDK